MQIVLTTLNAKFCHSSLALHSLKQFCLGKTKSPIEIVEFTVNQPEKLILSQLYSLKPDILGVSCYIWNIEITRRILSSLKKILPSLIIIAGGPEPCGEPADHIIEGEGEAAFLALLNGEPAPCIIPSLDEIPFAYQSGLNGLENKILYYETSRGCPFGCKYCLSAADKSVRFLSWERCKSDLSFFLAEKVSQVKLIDRTFNVNKKHCMTIWQFLIENDNGITNFHFEIAADLLDDDMLNILAKTRPGQFQFEIGVQSTHLPTLAAVGRNSDLKRLFENVRHLKIPNNIHLHLDLIAGLPKESYQRFAKSFEDVYLLKPDHLQLGFLKLLKNSPIRGEFAQTDIIYEEQPPYEVLRTAWMSYDEISRLKGITQMVELFYNSGRFGSIITFMSASYPSNFEMYEALACFWAAKKNTGLSLSLMALFGFLYDFCVAQNIAKPPLKDLIKFDILRCDNIHNLPPWLCQGDAQKIKQYKNKAISEGDGLTTRNVQVEVFNYNVTSSTLPLWETWVLFDYSRGKGRDGLYPIKIL